MIYDLNTMKKYKEDTFYIACSIADRYILKLQEIGAIPKCFMDLAMTALLMAAKLEQ